MHRLVQEFISGNSSTLELVKNHSAPHTSGVQALKKLFSWLETKQGKVDFEEVLKLAFLEDDLDLKVLVLTNAATIAFNFEHGEMLEYILNLLEELSIKKCAPVIQCAAMFTKILKPNQNYKNAAFQNVLYEGLDSIGDKSPKYADYLNRIAWYYSYFNSEENIFIKRLLNSDLADRYKLPVKFNCLFHSAKFEEGYELIARLQNIKEQIRWQMIDLSMNMYQLRAYLGRREAADDGVNSLYDPYYYISIRSPQKALNALNSRIKGGVLKTYPKIELDYLRLTCELSLKNLPAAKICLRNITYHNKADWLWKSEFAFMRYHFLAGDDHEAERMLAIVVDRVKTFGFHKLFFNKLHYAMELSNDHLKLIYEEIGKKNTKGQKSSKPLEKFEKNPILNESSNLAYQLDDQVRKLSKIQVPVLVLGETGTGKEVVARGLHELGPNKKEPFVAVNCGAFVSSLLSAELFGYVKGAFTGAFKDKEGLFVEAGKGTLFLDEIGELPLELQASLLRVLDQKEIRRVGDNKTRPIHCRVVAATNRDLLKMIKEGSFREDLYFRLNKFEINLLPLVERRSEIVPLSQKIIASLSENKAIFDEELLSYLKNKAWPGNIRQLKNELEVLFLLNTEKELLTLNDYIAANEEKVVKKDTSQDYSEKKRIDVREDQELPLFNSNQKLTVRRIANIKALFEEHQILTRKEIMGALGVTGNTATKDLNHLVAEGFLKKIEPSSSPRSHYFEIAKQST